MPLRRATVSEWLSLAAIVLATFGVSLAMYRLVGHFNEGTVGIGLSGWQFAFGVLPWVFVALSALAIVAPRIPGLSPAARFLPFVPAALAALALIFAIAGFADKPGQAEFGAMILQNIGQQELKEIAAPALGWTPIDAGIDYGAGLYLLTVAALLSLGAGGALLVLRRAVALTTTGATAATAGMVSPPAAPASGITGEWQVPSATAVVAAPAVTTFPGSAATKIAPPAEAADATVAATIEGDAGISTVAAKVALPVEAVPSAESPPADETEERAATPPPAAAFCVRCGAAYRSDSERFCTRCGASRSA